VKTKLSKEQANAALMHKVDLVARANGCEVIDYELAISQRNKGLYQEGISLLAAFGVGFLLGIVLISLVLVR